MFHWKFLESASKVFNSSSIDICLFSPQLRTQVYQETTSVAYYLLGAFCFIFIKTSYRVSTLDSSDEEEEVMSIATTTKNNNQRKDSPSFNKKGFPISSAG